MSYSFDHRSDTAKQVRKIARDQVEGAIDLIEAGGDFDKTVHELRRRCKKVRGLLRLVRPNFKAFDAENAQFRYAADSLSASRDAAVMVETYDKALKAPWAKPLASADKSGIREILSKNAADVAARQDGTQLFADFARSMNDTLQRIKDWSFKDEGFGLLEPGFRDTYARLRKGMETARKSGESEDFHDWRKDAKYHWFHVSLFKACAPDVLGSRREHLDRLGEMLGDHHNLFVLLETLNTLSPYRPQSIIDGLLGLQDGFAHEAFALGRQLVVKTPSQMTQAMGQFWKLLPEDK